MDYYLYKVEDEAIANYDYFAIRVNVNPIFDDPNYNFDALKCTALKVKLELPYGTDHFYEYGPGSTSKAKNISVNLGFGNSGVSGNIGFNFAPGSNPTIDTTYNSSNRTVLWHVKQYWFFGSYLTNAMYPFGATWASAGNLAAINISNYVEFQDYESRWNEIQVRYSY